MNTDQRAIIIGIAAVVLVVGGYFGWKKILVNPPQPAATASEQAAPSPADVKSASEGAETSDVNTMPSTIDKQQPATPVTKTASGPLSYEAALNLYRQAGGYFQLVKCSASPGMISLKRGVKFMVDNRDKTLHRIGFGKAAYTVKGYSFLILTATAPGTVTLTCDGGGAGQVNIEG